MTRSVTLTPDFTIDVEENVEHSIGIYTFFGFLWLGWVFIQTLEEVIGLRERRGRSCRSISLLLHLIMCHLFQGFCLIVVIVIGGVSVSEVLLLLED